MTYDVTVQTDITFLVEAKDYEEAMSKAIAEAESHNGNYYDWQVQLVKEME